MPLQRGAGLLALLIFQESKQLGRRSNGLQEATLLVFESITGLQNSADNSQADGEKPQRC